MTDAGALGGGTSHFTAPDARANYTAPANTQAAVQFNNAQFGVVPIAEALDVGDPSNIVISSNVMPFHSGDQFILTHTEVVSAGGLDQDTYNTFSPQPDAPGATHGCVYGALQGSFYSWQTRCDVAQNGTQDSLYLGHGGTHTIPGAQFVTEGRFTGGADFSLENQGTAIAVRPPNGDTAANGLWRSFNFVDFDISTSVANAWTVTTNPNPGLPSSVSFGVMNMGGTGTMTYPVYNVGTDGAPTIVISHATAQGTYTTTGHYSHGLTCGSPLVNGTATQAASLGALGAAWSTGGSGIETLTLTAATAPTTDITVTLNCAYVP